MILASTSDQLREGRSVIFACDLSSGYGVKIDDFAALTRRFAHVPCLAVIGDEQEMSDAVRIKGAMSCLSTPPDPGKLQLQVKRLAEEAISGSVRRIPVHSLLQMIESERKTCTLRVRRHGETGWIFMENGMAVAAETASLLGEEAIYAIIGWQEGSIDILYYNGQRPREIEQPVIALIMEAFRLKDESDGGDKPQEQSHIPALIHEKVSVLGKRVALEIGTDVELVFDGEQNSHICSMVGMVPQQYIIVTGPRERRSSSDSGAAAEKVVVRYIQMGRLCMFRTRLVDEIHSPKHLLFLAYPQAVHIRELRRAQRTTTMVPANLAVDDSDPISGVLVDVSTMGCQFFMTIKEEVPIPPVDIDSRIELNCFFPGGAEKTTVFGRVRNIHKSKVELRLGIQFESLPAKQREALAQYVDSAEGGAS